MVLKILSDPLKKIDFHEITFMTQTENQKIINNGIAESNRNVFPPFPHGEIRN